MHVALLLLFSFAGDVMDDDAARDGHRGPPHPRGQLVDLEPAWTGVAAGSGAAAGTLAGIGALIAINTLGAPDGVVSQLVDDFGIFIPIAGAAFGALAATAFFLAPGDAWIVGTASMSGASTAGAIVLVGASFVAILSARNGNIVDATVPFIVAGVAATIASAAVATPIAIVLDESAL